MKRVYRITLVVEHEFDRKATRAAKDAKRDLELEANRRGWVFVRASITNRAKPERMPPEPSPEKVYEEIAQGQALTELREIATDMAFILGNVKKPRVEFAPNRWCDGKFTYNAAHAHIQANVRWVRGPRAGRKIPKGLICISARKIVKFPRERWPWLMAHEIMHVRMPGGSHRRAKFGPAVDKLLADYAAFKEGYLIEPQEASA